jgi:hypothetical protein
MPSYDASGFDPPAPVARMVLRNPHSGGTVSDVPLLLDTGADVTLLPRTAVERLGILLLVWSKKGSSPSLRPMSEVDRKRLRAAY